MKRLITIVCGIALGLAPVVTAYAKQGVDPAKKIINLAGYDSCTGKFGDYGSGDKRGQELAVAEINHNGGIPSGPLKGYKLKLTFFDDQGQPQQSANLAKQISAGDYLVALGPTISSCALAATPVFARSEVPDIVTYANANTITSQGFDNILRLTYTTTSIARYMATQVKNKFKNTKVAIISDNQSYGQQLLVGFKSKAKELGIKIVSHSVTTPGQNVFSAMLMKAKMKQPDELLLFLTSYSAAGLIVKQARELDWNVTIYVPDAMTQPKFFALAGNLKNVYIQLSPTINIKRPAAKALKEAWNKKYEGFPPVAAVYGYDAVKVAEAVIEAGGIDHQTFIDKMKHVKVVGIANPLYTFAKNGDTSSLPEFVTVSAEQYYQENIKQ
jgi:branched-chain amino acid transport system substrate-binding protein